MAQEGGGLQGRVRHGSAHGGFPHCALCALDACGLNALRASAEEVYQPSFAQPLVGIAVPSVHLQIPQVRLRLAFLDADFRVSF